MTRDRTLWIVSGGAEAVPGIQRARAMGLHVVVSDMNPAAPGLTEADEAIIGEHLRRGRDGRRSGRVSQDQAADRCRHVHGGRRAADGGERRGGARPARHPRRGGAPRGGQAGDEAGVPARGHSHPLVPGDRVDRRAARGDCRSRLPAGAEAGRRPRCARRAAPHRTDRSRVGLRARDEPVAARRRDGGGVSRRPADQHRGAARRRRRDDLRLHRPQLRASRDIRALHRREWRRAAVGADASGAAPDRDGCHGRGARDGDRQRQRERRHGVDRSRTVRDRDRGAAVGRLDVHRSDSARRRRRSHRLRHPPRARREGAGRRHPPAVAPRRRDPVFLSAAGPRGVHRGRRGVRPRAVGASPRVLRRAGRGRAADHGSHQARRLRDHDGRHAGGGGRPCTVGRRGDTDSH